MSEEREEELVEEKKPLTGKESPKRKAKRKAGQRSARRAKAPRPYPKVLLAKALEIAQQIKARNGGEPWPPAQVAEAIGMGPRTPLSSITSLRLPVTSGSRLAHETRA